MQVCKVNTTRKFQTYDAHQIQVCISICHVSMLIYREAHKHTQTYMSASNSFVLQLLWPLFWFYMHQILLCRRKHAHLQQHKTCSICVQTSYNIYKYIYRYYIEIHLLLFDMHMCVCWCGSIEHAHLLTLTYVNK